MKEKSKALEKLITLNLRWRMILKGGLHVYAQIMEDSIYETSLKIISKRTEFNDN